ncbi:MAG TPA: cobalamin-dependent protein [Acidimicrobiales bacterium]|nr:cobalamin-dependent protein [Acidimicrobiales bacterium]
MGTLGDELAIAMAELEEEKVLGLVQEGIAAGEDPLELVRSLQDGMTEVGARFESGDYFLNELVMSGEIMKEAMVEIEPLLHGAEQEYHGLVVIGTVKGDIHDLGKNIVVMLLKGAGYEVVDLGVDVPAERFVEAVKEHNARLVGMCALLTASQGSMKETIERVRSTGLDTKIVIGGSYMNETIRENVGADYFGTTANDAVKLAEEVFASA